MKSPWCPRMARATVGLSSICASAIGVFAQCEVSTYSIGLGVRMTPAVMVHPETGELWMYGSRTSRAINDTWVRRAAGWELVHTGGPMMGQMEFDPITRAPVMVKSTTLGEVTASVFTGEFWRPVAITPPADRIFRQVAWALDRDTGDWVFAGKWRSVAADVDVQETWRCAGGVWTYCGSSPVRMVHMTHSQARGRFVAVVDSDNVNGAIWEWDGVNWTATGLQNQWLRDTVHSTVSSDGSVIFAGGNLGSQEWNGTTLTILPYVETSTDFYSAFRDSQSGNIWAVGGVPYIGIVPLCFQTNVLIGEQWVAHDRTVEVGNRFTAGSWNPTLGTFVAFGGLSSGPIGVSQTFQFREKSWEEQVTPVRPAWRFRPAMGYDSVSGKTLLFGGGSSYSMNDTWLFDGTTWTRYTGLSPSPRREVSLATDTFRNRMVLMGRGDTWEWDGTQWISRGVGPTAFKTPLVYDPVRHVCVSFSGLNDPDWISCSQNTRIWDGVRWTESILPGPHFRELHDSYFDQALGGVVVSGGKYTYLTSPGSSETLYFSDSWLFNGTSWTLLPGQYVWPSVGGFAGQLPDGKGAIIAGHLEGTEADVVRVVTTAPYVFRQPRGGDATRGQVLALDAGVGGNHDSLTFQWLRDGQPLLDGGRVQGATSVHLRIADVRDDDAGSFVLRVTNACTSTDSDAAIVRVCAADFNADGMVDLFDYLDFVDAWASLRSEADFDGDGVVDLFDYLDFVERFGVGC